MSSGVQGGSPTSSEVLNWINDVLDVDPHYLHLHHNMMQAIWHQYIECTSMRVGMLIQHMLERYYERNTHLVSSQLMNNYFAHLSIKQI